MTFADDEPTLAVLLGANPSTGNESRVPDEILANEYRVRPSRRSLYRGYAPKSGSGSMDEYPTG